MPRRRGRPKKVALPISAAARVLDLNESMLNLPAKTMKMMMTHGISFIDCTTQAQILKAMGCSGVKDMKPLCGGFQVLG